MGNKKEERVMLKVGVILLIIMLAFAGVYSLMSIFASGMMAGSVYKAMSSGKAFDSIQDGFAVMALKGIQRSQGAYALTTVISGFFVLFAGFKKAQKWAWWAFLFVGGIAWLWGLINGIAIMDKLNIILSAIGTVIFLVGLFLPYNVFFAKKAGSETQEA